ncbi:hypothetical protein [Sphingomonas crusticola]|uniref:hypothetical protein n=1 Tax=Sphingomonas crusticola TaxID=1697973 RepID=UPI0013C2E28D|nr:hypothetical protein [Sphingomonas crusticola]
MPKILDRWTVFPHGPLEQIDDRLLTVSGDIPMPLGNFPRRMTVIGLSGGRTAIWSAMALGEPEMARIEALGRPSFLIVPSGYHRMDAPIWKARYPDIKVITPPGARERVAQVVPVEATDDILDDSDARFQVVPGSGARESALFVRRASGSTLIVNDVIGHVRHPRGIVAHVLTRLLGFGASGPQIPRDMKRLLITDPEALAAQFRLWASDLSLARIIVSHGEPITAEPAAVLRALAARLDA